MKLGRMAGPYDQVPYKNYIQSPIRLVEKDGGHDTHMIFHLSYPRNGDSVNSCTPVELCSVKYPDFSEAVQLCLREGKNCKIGKSDVKSTFRNLGIKCHQWHFLILKCKSPFDGVTYYFVEKALSFGASISCLHFQRVSNAIAHIVKVRNHGKSMVNYLHDYLFCLLWRHLCNQQIRKFLEICELIKLPVAVEKTHWAVTILPFLGMFLNTVDQIINIPADKIQKAKQLLLSISRSHKTTVGQMQKLCGTLNFLCRAIVPGRAFTRRLYASFNTVMCRHYHISVNTEMRQDMDVWLRFLNNPLCYCRPFCDFSVELIAEDIDWFTDALGVIGIGGHWGPHWFQAKWNESFLKEKNPSIEFQELLVVTGSILLWAHNFQNQRIALFCDNQTTCGAICNTTSGCKNCMTLIRLIVHECLVHNVRIFAKHVRSASNYLADSLSRFQMTRFWDDVEKDGREMDSDPQPIPEVIWLVEKIWKD